jgi:hypothetical protein
VTNRLRFTFEDFAQPQLLEGLPDPDDRKGMGAFWRRQWGRKPALDAMELRLVVEGEPPGEPDVTVELDFDPDWTAVHRLVRHKGTWIVQAGDPEYLPRRHGVGGEPGERKKREANLDRHLPRIRVMIDEAVALDDRFKGPRLWQLIPYDWDLKTLRSRRGRHRELDADEIDRLMTEGKTAKEIAEMYGVAEKTPFNVLRRARKRRT